MPHATRSKEKPQPAEADSESAEQPEATAEVDAETEAPGSAPAAHGSGSSSSAAPPTWTYGGPGMAPPPRRAAEPRTDDPLVRPRPIVPPSDAERLRTAGNLSLGPVGKRRPPLTVAILSALTLGVYAVVWHRRINVEMGDFDTRMHVRPGRSTIAVAIPWLLGLLVSLAGGARIVLDVLHVSLPFDPHFSVFQAYFAAGALLVVPYAELLLSLSAVAIVMTLERIRLVEDRAGLTTDVQIRPAEDVWSLAFPVIGGLVLVFRAQRRLNAAWEQAMPSPLARISQY